jgi:ribosomal protein S18 acetylase RimI-like enzyme
MMKMEQTETILVPRAGLSPHDLEAIGALVAVCKQHDGRAMTLNWDLMRTRAAGLTSDFLVFAAGALAGYAALDAFGSEAELRVVVHPAHRRRGIGSRLLDAASGASRQRGFTHLRLIREAGSPTCGAFVAAHGARLRYASADCRLELDLSSAAPLPASSGAPIALRLARAADLELLIGIRRRCFPSSREDPHTDVPLELQEPGSRLYLAFAAEEPVGTVGTIPTDGGLYLRALGVLPEHQRRGYGRQMLNAIVADALAAGHARCALWVAAENRPALELYLSGGFFETKRFEYYDVALASAPDSGG